MFSFEKCYTKDMSKPCKKCGSTDRLPPYKTKKTGPCRPCVYAKNERLRKTNPDKYTEQDRKYKYGVTKEQYLLLLKKQDSKCAICLIKDKLEIDHDHVTNKIRGLLCGRCNRAIGLFKDNPENTARATAYLEKL